MEQHALCATWNSERGIIDETEVTVAEDGIFWFGSRLLTAAEMCKDFSAWTERLEGLIVIISVRVLLLAYNSARYILVLSFRLLQGLASGLFLSGLSVQFCFYSCVFRPSALCCWINMQFHRSCCWSVSWWTSGWYMEIGHTVFFFFKSSCTHNQLSKQTWCYLISRIRTVLLNSVK